MNPFLEPTKQFEAAISRIVALFTSDPSSGGSEESVRSVASRAENALQELDTSHASFTVHVLNQAWDLIHSKRLSHGLPPTGHRALALQALAAAALHALRLASGTETTGKAQLLALDMWAQCHRAWHEASDSLQALAAGGQMVQVLQDMGGAGGLARNGQAGQSALIAVCQVLTHSLVAFAQLLSAGVVSMPVPFLEDMARAGLECSKMVPQAEYGLACATHACGVAAAAIAAKVEHEDTHLIAALQWLQLAASILQQGGDEADAKVEALSSRVHLALSDILLRQGKHDEASASLSMVAGELGATPVASLLRLQVAAAAGVEAAEREWGHLLSIKDCPLELVLEGAACMYTACITHDSHAKAARVYHSLLSKHPLSSESKMRQPVPCDSRHTHFADDTEQERALVYHQLMERLVEHGQETEAEATLSSMVDEHCSSRCELFGDVLRNVQARLWYVLPAAALVKQTRSAHPPPSSTQGSRAESHARVRSISEGAGCGIQTAGAVRRRVCRGYVRLESTSVPVPPPRDACGSRRPRKPCPEVLHRRTGCSSSCAQLQRSLSHGRGTD